MKQEYPANQRRQLPIGEIRHILTENTLTSILSMEPAFVLKAVNNHYQLIEALEIIKEKLQQQASNRKLMQVAGPAREMLNIINKALAKAHAEENI